MLLITKERHGCYAPWPIITFVTKDFRIFRKEMHLLLILLHPEVDGCVLGIVRAVPEDLLGLALAIPVDGEPVAAALGQVAFLVDAEAGGVGVLGGGAGVGDGQADGRDGVLDDVQVLPAGGGLVLGGEGDGAALALAADCVVLEWIE